MANAGTDKCGNCGHAFSYHAPDLSTPHLRCWDGACTGDGCEKACKDFVQDFVQEGK